MQQYLSSAGITSNPDDVHIGGVRLIDIPGVVDSVIRQQQAQDERILMAFSPGDLVDGFADLLRLLSFREFQKTFEKESSERDLHTKNKYYPITRHGNSFKGYISYLQATNPDKAQFFLRWLDAHITEKDRQAHTYLVAGSTAGKSNLLKIFIHNDIKKDRCSLVILDPAGKLAHEVVHFKDFAEEKKAKKLIYIDPALGHKNGVYCILNPFEIAVKDIVKLDRATDELTRAINQILKDSEAGLTDQMQLIVLRMVAVLLYKGNSSFWDLLRFLNNEQNSDLIEIGKHHPNQAVKEFFIYRFGIDKDLNQSIGRIKTRIEKLSSNTLFMRSITGKSTVNLEQAIDSGMKIICNFSAGNLGESTSRYLGKLFVAQIQIFSMQRQDKDIKNCIPVHVVIDEMQNYITQSIEQFLTQSAKYKYYLTLANQYIGQNDGAIGTNQFYTALLGNTGVKIIGKAGYDTINEISKEIGVSKETLGNLKRGQFYVKVGSNTPFMLTASTRLLDEKNSMSAEEWKKLESEQLQKYYRKYDEERPHYTVSKNTQGVDNVIEPDNVTPKKFTRKFPL